MQHTIAAQIGHVPVDIRNRYFFNKIEVHIHDGDLIELQVAQRRIPRLLEVAEKVAKIQKILVNRAPGVRFDRFMIRKKIAQDRRRFCVVIRHWHRLQSKKGFVRAALYGKRKRPKEITQETRRTACRRVFLR